MSYYVRTENEPLPKGVLKRHVDPRRALEAPFLRFKGRKHGCDMIDGQRTDGDGKAIPHPITQVKD